MNVCMYVSMYQEWFCGFVSSCDSFLIQPTTDCCLHSFRCLLGVSNYIASITVKVYDNNTGQSPLSPEFRERVGVSGNAPVSPNHYLLLLN